MRDATRRRGERIVDVDVVSENSNYNCHRDAGPRSSRRTVRCPKLVLSARASTPQATMRWSAGARAVPGRRIVYLVARATLLSVAVLLTSSLRVLLAFPTRCPIGEW